MAPASRSCVLILALLMVLTLPVRLSMLGESLWIDELHTSWSVAGSWDQVAPRAWQGNQSPAYYYLLWGLVQLVGGSELALRLPSLLAGQVLIALIYLWAKNWSGDRLIAATTALAAGLDANFVFFATEARPYAFVQLTALLTAGVTYRRWRAPTTTNRAAFVILGAVLFYLHYTAALIVAAEVLLLLIAGCGPQRNGRWTVLVDTLLLCLACVPAAPHLAVVFQRRQAWASFVPRQSALTILTMLHAARFVVPAAVGMVVTRIVNRSSTSNALRAFAAKPAPAASDEVKQRTILLSIWWLLPVGFAWLTTQTGLAHLLLNRYLIGVAAAPVLLSALMCGWIRRSRIRYVCCAVILAWTLGDDGYARWMLHNERPAKLTRGEDWRGLMDFLSKADSPTADEPDAGGRETAAPLPYPVIVRSGLIEAAELSHRRSPELHAYCAFMFGGLYDYPLAERTLIPVANQPPFGITPAMADEIQRAGGAWIVVRAGSRQTTKIVQQLLQAIRQQQTGEVELSFAVDRRLRFGRLHLWRITARREVDPMSAQSELPAARAHRSSPGSAAGPPRLVAPIAASVLRSGPAFGAAVRATEQPRPGLRENAERFRGPADVAA